ncbi:hypothetical protein CR513_57939, partial [Mucuna pruriens]
MVIAVIVPRAFRSVLYFDAYCKVVIGCVFVCYCDQAALHQHQVIMALNSTFSNPTVHVFGTHVPKSAPHVSDTFSLSPIKACNFGLTKLVQNKGFLPLHAVPAKTMVELDNLVLQAQEPPKEPKVVNVTFQLHRICNYGEQYLVVGSDALFGSWDPAKAIPMAWSEGHVWTVSMGVPAGKFQFKYILKRKGGEIVWQPGPDRTLHTWEAMTKISVYEDWNTAQLQKVTEDNEVQNTNTTNTTEEEQVAHTDMELKMESEMPNMADNLNNSPKEKPKSKSPSQNKFLTSIFNKWQHTPRDKGKLNTLVK